MYDRRSEQDRGGLRSPPILKGKTMKKKKHAFWRCPKCRKEGKLLEEESFIYYHTCKHGEQKRMRRWSGNSGRLIGEVYTDNDSLW